MALQQHLVLTLLKTPEYFYKISKNKAELMSRSQQKISPTTSQVLKKKKKAYLHILNFFFHSFKERLIFGELWFSLLHFLLLTFQLFLCMFKLHFSLFRFCLRIRDACPCICQIAIVYIISNLYFGNFNNFKFPNMFLF